MRKGLVIFITNPLRVLLVGTAGFELATPCTPCKEAKQKPLFFNKLTRHPLATVL
nr:MAG TPA: hypothetical protein [Caudoviricetes sp.]